MLHHVNDSKYGDVVKMLPVTQEVPRIPQPAPSKRVFKDRPTTGLPVLNGIQCGHYAQPTNPVVTPVPKDNYKSTDQTDTPRYAESTVNNPIDFYTPSF